MNKNLNTDNLFREKLDGFSEQPPSHVWDAVKGKLAAQQRKKRFVYAGWITAAAVIVLAFLAGWYFNNYKEIKIPDLAEQNPIQPKINEHKKTAPNDKNLSAEFVPEKQLNTENINTENANRDNNLLQTAKLESPIVDDRNVTESTSQRLNMNLLKRIDALILNAHPKLFLAEKSVQKVEYSLNESDKFLIAENSKSLNTKNKGWKMGMHLSPGYSSHTAAHTENYAQNMNFTADDGNGNVGGGFSVQYKTTKKLSVESGVYFVQNGQKSVNSIDLFAANQNADFALGLAGETRFDNAVNLSKGNLVMNSTAGVIEMAAAPKGTEIISELDAFNPEFSNSLVSDGQFSQVFEFIEIPLFLRYKVVDSKFGIELVGGINAGIVVGNNAYIDNSYGLQNIGKTQDISTVNLSGTVGVGMNYGLGKHISVAVEPRLNYYFYSINSNPEVDFRPYRIGVFTGLYYEF